MANDTFRALVILPDGTHEFRDVPHSVPGMQSLIDGGYTEAVTMGDDVLMLVDEDGMSKGLAPNIAATSLTAAMGRPTSMILLGPVAFVGIDGGEEMLDVPERVATLVA